MRGSVRLSNQINVGFPPQGTRERSDGSRPGFVADAPVSAFWPLAAFSLLFGGFYGGWVALLPALVMDWFGARRLAGIIGILYTSVGIGTLVGPAAAGRAFDLTGSYAAAILGCAAAGLLGTGAVALAGRLHRARVADGL